MKFLKQWQNVYVDEQKEDALMLKDREIFQNVVTNCRLRVFTTIIFS